MNRRAMWLALLAAGVALASVPGSLPLDVGTGERLLVVAPHPDDETLGAGGLIERVLAHDGSVRVVIVTAGDGYVEAVVHETGRPRPRPAEYVAYGERRLGEARAALRTLAGGRPVRLQFLGFPDGGLEPLLRAHWTAPERSPTTDAERPPYPEAADRHLAYDGVDLRRELVSLLRETQPTLVAFPDPLDRHPDHHATAVFTLLALGDFTRAHAPLPRLLAYLVHWPAWPPGWESSAPAADPQAPLEMPADLSDRARAALALTPADVTRKSAALARYASQQELMAPFLASFVRRTEPFSVMTAEEVRRAATASPSAADSTPARDTR